MSLYPVILSGGSGTRLWPLSRAALPKQLLPLASEKTLLQETVLRLSGLMDAGAPLIVCNNDHRFLIAEQMRDIEVTPLAIFLEPVGRNTAPAAAIAALHLLKQDADAVMLLLPADHLIRDVPAFHTAIGEGMKAVASSHLVTFGIVPDAPETGYGYIQQGAALDACGAHNVARFVEKPRREDAEQFLASGDYFWNSGMFLFSCKQFLDELGEFRPDILAACEQALARGQHDLDFCRLDKGAFAACPSDSIDYALMEHTRHAAVVPTDIGWNDIGAWSALWEVGEKDTAGNVTRGDVFLESVSNSLIRAESRMVAAIGVSNLLIVETPDALLVADKSRAQEVKKVVDYLKANGRSEHEFHTRVFRPWGWYEGIDLGERFQVKRIMVKPGEKLSLQMHHHRAEHWIVVSGTARITRDGVEQLLCEDESTYIPLGTTHRLENPGRIPLHLIEVQSGSYLGEDDIVRFEDIYQRS
ncbi:MAG: mannose-1-phosphate guanylyltransferase/mannose-6-phosphate isomerase [Hydrogenophilales bacterium CG_4_9_14_3_um_filter_63_34]|nr:MAG: mannose-1-phosphate guanylyltransferase/mannose-6-phosphate isomerase [Hydrogenophilales bacterium CG_4_10_14_3_um_filter_63_21]PJB04256.1 MAG: mannose-1-phosphate guanylyltransferase/mannose-6-phosphate isomerase [Hydrogenophilales bacterium CG_4_9_14_3_um_filter_63_34]